MEMKRASGILLHPTSFPGPHGIGDLGKAAYQFVDFLAEAKQSLWQVLPIGPTGYGDSPYASFSSFAGNPLLINLDELVEAGDLSPKDLADVPSFPADKVDYGPVINWKMPLLEKAATNFIEKAGPERQIDYQAFWKEHFHWLDDYSMFMAIKEEFDRKAQEAGVDGAMWSNYWDEDIRLRDKKAIAHWREKKADAIKVKNVLQYYFFRQWGKLKDYANEQGIKIIGDIPIFVAADSVDVWANPEIFILNEKGQPTVVAGVPPDYFSETGQLWGNPLYDWKAMQKNDFKWWLKRIKGTLKLIDIIRIDHFRGFEAYWEVKAGSETAINGKWVKAPGKKLFKTVQKELGDIPIIAEDLGIITKEVEELRDEFNFPGMKILQFAFDVKESGGINSNNLYLPHNHQRNAVVYTGTHDNDTTLGWYQGLSEQEQETVQRYLGQSDENIVWGMIRVAMRSVCALSIVPLQDVLNLGSEARMNTPSTTGGNWGWRYDPADLSQEIIDMLRQNVELYGR
jgi:4-alpha-glucanotransferase